MTRSVRLGVFTLLFGATAASAQERMPVPVEPARIEIEKIAQAGGQFRAAFEMRTTRGAPYSAEAVTEFVQTLADGNRIARRSIVKIYRDSEGRVRRENMTADGSTVEFVTISDPVTGRTTILDPSERAFYPQPGRREMSVRVGPGALEVERKKIEEAEARKRGEAPMPPPPYPAPAPRTAPPLPPAAPPPAPVGARMRVPVPQKGNEERQDLGQRTIDGVAARGTRTTIVIPAGTIGNEQPIRIVSEEWFSPDLQVLVQTRHTDPRSGETIYTLSNIVRAEPDRSLFEVPADYSHKVPTKRELPSRE